MAPSGGSVPLDPLKISEGLVFLLAFLTDCLLLVFDLLQCQVVPEGYIVLAAHPQDNMSFPRHPREMWQQVIGRYCVCTMDPGSAEQVAAK